MSATDTQVGGNHYKSLAIQPVEYIHANSIGYFEGCAIKYLTRWKSKGGIQDLEKAKHYIELLIEMESKELKTIESNNDGWIKWNGGECPVDLNLFVKAKLKNGKIMDARKAIEFNWDHCCSGSDIVAYRIIPIAKA